MTTLFASNEENCVEKLIGQLLETRDNTMKEVSGEITVGDEVCTLTCKPKSTRDSLIRDYYSWLRTHNHPRP